MAIDKEAIKKHIRGILIALGENPDREGLLETPERVARMCGEVFEGMNYSNEEIARMFDKSFEEGLSGSRDRPEGQAGQNMVLVKDIDLFSYCEHHMALMYDMKAAVAYIPRGKVLGLSKIARIADMAAKRLQIQERLGQDIAEIITLASGSPDVAVILSGYHSCVSARGIKKENARTVTTAFTGKFREDPALLNQLNMMLSQ